VDGPHSSFPRTWSRSATYLRREADPESITESLQRRWPPSEYPVPIHIVGSENTEGITVRIWNSTGIQEREMVYPGDQGEAENPVASAALEEVDYILQRLQQQGKLKPRS